jgi:hypothetical protein
VNGLEGLYEFYSSKCHTLLRRSDPFTRAGHWIYKRDVCAEGNQVILRPVAVRRAGGSDFEDVTAGKPDCYGTEHDR